MIYCWGYDPASVVYYENECQMMIQVVVVVVMMMMM
jgi:hypothetical protein